MSTLEVIVNGEQKTLNEDTSLNFLLEKYGYSNLIFAVAINECFIPRRKYHETILKPHDRIEILFPMQGG